MGICEGGLVIADSLNLLGTVLFGVVIVGRDLIVERGRGSRVLGEFNREDVLIGEGESGSVGFGVIDREDLGVTEVERELIGLGGADAALLGVEAGEERLGLMFQGGLGGGVFLPLVVGCGGFGATTGFGGDLTAVERCTVSFGGGGGGRVGAATVANRFNPN